MRIQCDACEEKFEVADELITQGSVSSVTCPACRADVKFKSHKQEPVKDLEFYYNEQLCEYDKKALICNTDKASTNILKEYLADEGYLIHIPSNLNEALRCLVSYNYNVIILDENFGVQNANRSSILAYLNYRMPIATRRGCLVMLLTTRYKTLNRLAAFNHSVNAVFNIADIETFHMFAREVAQEHEKQYRVFNNVQQNLQELMFNSGTSNNVHS